jgi:hypothetical protein
MGPHLCVQFHPEVDEGVVASWVDTDPSDFITAGIELADVLAETRRREGEARIRAAALVDRFCERARVPSGP